MLPLENGGGWTFTLKASYSNLPIFLYNAKLTHGLCQRSLWQQPRVLQHPDPHSAPPQSYPDTRRSTPLSNLLLLCFRSMHSALDAMALPAELCCLERFPADFHPLHALLWEPGFQRLFGGRAPRSSAVLALHRDRQPPLYLSAACPQQPPPEPGPPAGDGPLRIYLSGFCHKHYGLQPAPRLRVSAARPAALSRVVLGAKSRQGLRWAGSESFAAGLLLLARRGQPVLARQGDLLAVPPPPGGEEPPPPPSCPPELLVLECRPLLQGLIAADTSLLLVDLRDPAPLCPLRGPQPLYVSDFARAALRLSGGGGGDSLLESGKAASRSAESVLEIRVRAAAGGLPADPSSALFVSRFTLRRLGLFQREWVSGSLQPERGRPGAGGAARSRLLSVVVVDFPRFQQLELPDGVGLVSPVLWFNLTGGAPVPSVSGMLKLKRCNEWCSSDRNLQRDSCSTLFTPPFAKELHVQIVSSPAYSTRGVYDSMLFTHFQTVRLVQMGDILCVSTEGQPDYLTSHSEGFKRWPCLYFKVKKILAGDSVSQPLGYLVDTEHTTLYLVDCVSLCCDTSGATEARLQALFSESDSCRPCLLLLRNIHMLGKDRDGIGDDPRVVATLRQLLSSPARDSRGLPLIAMGTAYSLRDLSPEMQMAFLHEVLLEVPSEEQRRAVLSALTAPLSLGRDVNLSLLSKHTAGFVLGDFCALLSSACRAACRRVKRTCFPEGANVQEEWAVCAAGFSVVSEDFHTALEQLQEAHSRAIGAPKIPCVRWQDVGGLQDVKKEILDTIQFPLEHPELLALGLRRSGLLLYGPPGTGKTLLAKAVATECSMTFLSVKGPELINMYVGQSEENVREVFSRARAAAPCIIFFDELDSLAPNRGRSGDSGGVTDRVVSQFLAELDGLHSSGTVFVIGATNRPDLLDPALLRPGRFDRLLYVGIGEDRESQLNILKAISRKFKVDADVSFSDIIEKCPLRLTGADMYALCSDAMMTAIKRKISRIEEGLDTEESELLLTAEDFHGAAEKLQPSVSELELQKYKVIRQKFAAR
ncbi:peroxisomal ATPase PEX6 isoform X2 [Latimeria chalumnae]|uniref:peroxisomal ATPase PEX6 isoform X2 n=1 Tax=Latimeria chalumnae TaxID=7897 RepID=UPI00313EC6AD